MKAMTTQQAYARVKELNLPIATYIELVDIISDVNMGGWLEGKEDAMKVFAPDAHKIVYGAAKAS
jgi:hypothetical protein